MAPRLPRLSRSIPRHSASSSDNVYELLPVGRTLFRRSLITSSPNGDFSSLHLRQKYQHLSAVRSQKFNDEAAHVTANNRHPATRRAGRSWDPEIQRNRNDLAYAMYMLKRSHRHVSTDVTKLGTDIDTEAKRLGYTLSKRNGPIPTTKALNKQCQVEPKKIRKTKLPQIHNKVPISSRTLDFLDNIPVKFVINGDTVPLTER